MVESQKCKDCCNSITRTGIKADDVFLICINLKGPFYLKKVTPYHTCWLFKKENKK